MTWEIEPVADSCRRTVTHDQLRGGAKDQLFGGWPLILSGLKKLLETGETLTTPGSLRYLAAAPAGGSCVRAQSEPGGVDAPVGMGTTGARMRVGDERS